MTGHERARACTSPRHGLQATSQCACGETALGIEAGVTAQGRDWFYKITITSRRARVDPPPPAVRYRRQTPPPGGR